MTPMADKEANLPKSGDARAPNRGDRVLVHRSAL